jgi:hypothetical protein
MAEIHDLNVTDASNTARFPENMAPSAVNNSARALEGLVARYFFDNDTSVVATISASLITIVANRNSLTLTGTTSNYVANYMQAFTMGGNPNTGPVRVTVDGVGPISLRDNTGASLTSSVLLAGSRALMVKDGTNNYFRLIYPTVTASGYSDPLTTRGDILYRNSSNATARLAVGSANRFLKSDGTDVAWAALSGLGKVVAYSNTFSSTDASSSATAGDDDTIPQIGEMGEIVEVTHTPAEASNKILVQVMCNVAVSGQVTALLGLFKDGGGNALRITADEKADNGFQTMVLQYLDTAADTSEITYSVRMGSSGSTGTVYSGGQHHSGARFGNVLGTTVQITEFD